MLRALFVRVGTIVLAGGVLVACEPSGMDGSSQTLSVGDSTVVTGGTTFQGNTSGPSTISSGSITPNANFSPGTQEELRAVVGDRIFFETDSTDLNVRARGVLDELSRWITANPNKLIRIEGHADERGTREYNLALGDRRANAVVRYLTQRGVPASRLTTISFGKERPVASGSNATAWTQNRRAVFRVQ